MTLAAPVAHCPYCGSGHAGTCPRIKAIEYFENGMIKRVEFVEWGVAPPSTTITIPVERIGQVVSNDEPRK